MTDSFTHLLEFMLAAKASDLHVSESGHAFLRVNGELKEFQPSVNLEVLFKDFDSQLDSSRRQQLGEHGDIDLGLSACGERFRVHAYKQEGGFGLAIRHLASQIPTCEQLDIPDVVKGWALNETGLVIVTGPTGSGKTTTLAALTNAINQSRTCHIVTIEDPVEYHFPSGKAKIVHREIGAHSSDFARAVRAGLREDVDVMVIGEMRDRETIEAALAVAETGHLVFATLHTNNSAQAIDRLIDAFPAEEQLLTRSRLSACLLGVVYQRLLITPEKKRVAAFEVLVANQAVKALIRDGKTYQIPNVMETARAEGMQPMRQGLLRLANTGKIEREMVNAYFSKNV